MIKVRDWIKVEPGINYIYYQIFFLKLASVTDWEAATWTGTNPARPDQIDQFTAKLGGWLVLTISSQRGSTKPVTWPVPG